MAQATGFLESELERQNAAKAQAAMGATSMGGLPMIGGPRTPGALSGLLGKGTPASLPKNGAFYDEDVNVGPGL